MSAEPLSLADIARLAKVQRPVVSMWRKRERVHGMSAPFPVPVQREPDERFDVIEVLDWLRRTGRGNNPEAAVELPLLRRGLDLTGERTALLEALVTLRSIVDHPLADLDDETLVDLADAHDPDDEAVFSEIALAGHELAAAAAQTDDLCEAAFGPGAALAHLRRPDTADLTAAGLDLMRALVWQAATVGREEVTLVGLETSTQLSTALVPSVPEGVDLGVHVKDPGARWLHRQLRVHQVPALTTASGPTVHVMVATHDSLAALLDEVDDFQLQLTPGDVGIVLGPAAALVDRLPTPALDNHRAGLLRLGALRHVVRLPPGVDARAPRQSLALWIIAPHRRTPPPAARWLLTSDVSARALDEGLVDQIVGDVVAGLGSSLDLHRRAFATARVVAVPALLAGRKALVAPGSGHRQFPRSLTDSALAAQVMQTRSLLDTLDGRPTRRFGGVAVGLPASPASTPSLRHVPGEVVIVEDLLAEGSLRYLPGTRLDLDHLADGTVEVITADMISAHRRRVTPASIRVDALDLARRHPRARRVESGDIAFVTSPRPAAMVCREAGGVVAYPARILRVLDHALVPEVVAALIDSLPDEDHGWRTWSFPRADRAAYDALAKLLRAIEDERADLTTRHTQLDELTHLLTAGAARGTLSLTTAPIDGDH